jgi:hypothetical protein
MMNIFNIEQFFAAIDQQRQREELSWAALATAIWDQSSVLNAQRHDHPISAATISKLADGKSLSCQHTLFVLRWLGVPAETFVTAPQPGTAGVPLPAADAAHRLRWNLAKLYASLNAARTARDATWQQTADRLGCSPSQLTGLRTAKFGTGIETAMRITQALRRPAADFVYAAKW